MIQADFHIHSRYSFDSFLSPRSIVKTALKRQLSAIAVADHNTTKGALKTMDEAATTSLVVIPAIELETDAGHIMGLFIETDIRTQNIEEVLDEIEKQDGISVLLHPARMCGNNLKAAANKVDAIEALNARTRKSENLKAHDLALRLNLPVIAGSDAHTSFEIGRTRTVLETDAGTFENLRKEIIKGKRLLVGKESPYVVHAFSFGMQLAKYALRLA
jgi:predicted metal-dependent phosphoesterase TrpH